MVTPLIVRRALGNIKMGQPKPIWLETVTRLFPPVTFNQPEYIRKTKPGRTPKPPKITYPEDHFRRKFFADFPLETLRPTKISEISDVKGVNVTPEGVFEHQRELIASGISPEAAYELAMIKYQSSRTSQEISQRVALEQYVQAETQSPSTIIEQLVLEEKEILQKRL